MDKRNDEIEKVKMLGKEIGYGNLMNIANALWSVDLFEKYKHFDGAFIPVYIEDIIEHRKKTYRKKRANVISEIIQIQKQEGLE